MSEPEATPAASPPPKSKKKLLIIVAGLVVLLAGGGAGAYFMTRPADDAKGAKGAKAEKAKEHVEPIYVALDPPFVVNFESGELVRFLQVTVQAMAADPETAALVKQHDPVVRNALLMLLSGQSYDTLKSAEGKEKLRQAALAEIRKVVTAQGGKGDEVRDLYFTSFVMQ